MSLLSYPLQRARRTLLGHVVPLRLVILDTYLLNVARYNQLAFILDSKYQLRAVT